MNRLLALLPILLLSACQPPGDEAPDAQTIVDRAREAHGSERLREAVVSFDFRDRSFRAERSGGLFTYERTFADSLGRQVRDVLDNEGVHREVEGERVPLDSAAYRSAESGVNSVLYFALLPFSLNDPAVQKRLLGETTIDGEPYYEVEVTFRREGGGRDYEDRFVYWFHRDRHTMDYLAYTYDTDERGTRFRKAVNPRTAGGIRFADYLNYRHPDTLFTAIETYETLPPDSLVFVSEIVLENLEVTSDE